MLRKKMLAQRIERWIGPEETTKTFVESRMAWDIKFEIYEAADIFFRLYKNLIIEEMKNV